MTLYKGTRPRANKSNIPTPIWRAWNPEETPPTDTLTKKKPKHIVKPGPRSWSNNVVERKHGKGIRIPIKHSDNPRKCSIDRAASTTSLCFYDNVYKRQRMALNKVLGRRAGSAVATTGLRSELPRKCTLHKLCDIPDLYTDTDPREAQPSKSWVQTKPHNKQSVSLKYGLLPQPRKRQSPNRGSHFSPTRLRRPNTRLWSPKDHTDLNYQRGTVRDKTRANTERGGDRNVKINVKREGTRAATKKGSSHYAVVSRAPPPPKLGLSDTMHLDIKPGKGRSVIPNPR